MKKSPQSLATVEVKDELFRVDLEITQMFQSFSAELLRLSLLGIAGYGFLISEVALKEGNPSGFFAGLANSTGVLVAGVVTLGAAAALALAHRYFSSDCIVHQITVVRLAQVLSEPSDDEIKTARYTKRLKNEQRLHHRKIRACEWCLGLSAAFLGAGAIAVATTFASTLLSYKPPS